MKHTPVQSASIKSIAYDSDAQELHVDFHGSGGYIYHNVSQDKYQGLMMSSSKGQYLHQNVKGRHDHTKI